MAKHAKLGASAAYRWMNCPGSVRVIDALPPEERDRTSSHAEQGSAAHALGEECLRQGKDAEAFLGCVVAKHDRTGDYVVMPPEFPCDARTDYVVDEEMADAVQVYLDEVRRHLERLPAAELLVEERVAPLPSRPTMFGTADAIIHDVVDGELVVGDYKHGAGVVVTTSGQVQARFYALGALRRVGEAAVERVTLFIAQPRAPHADGPIRPETIDPAELLAFGDELEAAAARTEDPDAPLAAGEWCRFCPAAGGCPELRRRAFEEAAGDFSDDMLPATVEPERRLPLPDSQDPELLARALNAVPMIDAWCREVEGLAQRQMERGVSLPGWKLVRKRANRRWMDAKAVETALRNRKGVKVGDVYDRKLRSPAKLEKVKTIGKEWVERHCYRPDGELTVARADDPRPAAALPASVDFAEDLAALPPPALDPADPIFD